MPKNLKKLFKILIITVFFLQSIVFVAQANGQKQAISTIFKNISSLEASIPVFEEHKEYQIYGLSENELIPISGIIKNSEDLNSWLAMAVQTELQEKKQERNIMVFSCIIFAGFIFLFYQIIKEKRDKNAPTYGEKGSEIHGFCRRNEAFSWSSIR